MANDTRQPVAIRIARPYSSEESFLEHELETLTRTSVTLIGAQARPQGVVLRFEVTLASGAPLLRGEGRVVGYKPNAVGEEPGLTLRFTRLDPRSKALVDRATAMRDARARAAGRSVAPPPAPSVPPMTRYIPPTPPTPPPPPPGPMSFQPAGTDEPTQIGPPPSAIFDVPPSTAIPSGGVPPPPVASQPPPVTGRAPEAPPPTRPRAPPMSRPAPRSQPPPLPPSVRSRETTAYDRETLERLKSYDEPPPPTTVNPSAEVESSGRTIHEPPHAATPAPPTSAVATPAVPRTARAPLAAPPDRAALLERLRERARSLSPSRVSAILTRAAST